MEMPFRPPTDHYYKELAPIDEQICELLAKRKELSNNNPGFPSLELISEWSQKYGLNENWLRRIFASYMLYEERLQRPVEPTGFLKFVPILKSIEIDDMTYAVTHMKQYRNASVVYVETEVNTPEPYVILFWDMPVSNYLFPRNTSADKAMDLTTEKGCSILL